MCFRRTCDLSEDMEILNLCNSGDANKEQLLYMYHIPILPPLGPRCRGGACAHVEEEDILVQEHFSPVVPKEFHHNVHRHRMVLVLPL